MTCFRENKSTARLLKNLLWCVLMLSISVWSVEAAYPLRSPGPSYGIHVASFKNADFADRKVRALRDDGFPAFSKSVMIPQKGLWTRVFVGPYARRDDAEKEALTLRKKGAVDSYFIRKVEGAAEKSAKGVKNKADATGTQLSVAGQDAAERETSPVKKTVTEALEGIRSNLQRKGHSSDAGEQKAAGVHEEGERGETHFDIAVAFTKETDKDDELPAEATEAVEDAPPPAEEREGKRLKSSNSSPAHQSEGAQAMERSSIAEALRDFDRGEYREALVKFGEAAKEDVLSDAEREIVERRSADCHFFLGMAGDQRELPVAAEKYAMILRQHPHARQENDEALFRKAQAYDRMKLHYEALRELKKLVEGYGESELLSDALYLMGETYFSLDKFMPAARHFKEYTTRYPKGRHVTSAFFSTGECYSRSGRYLQADEWFNRALTAWPSLEDIPRHNLMVLGAHYFKSGRYDRSFDLYMACLNLYPDSERGKEALLMAGRVLTEKKRPEMAVKLFDQVLLRYPGSEEAWKSIESMADIGVKYPGISMPSYIFDGMEYYLDPFAAYEKITEEHADKERREELNYKKGIAYFSGARYQDAFDTFHLLLEKSPWSAYKKAAEEKLVKCALSLIDSYYEEEDHLAVSDIYLKSRRYGVVDHMGYDRLFNAADSLQHAGLNDRSRHILEELSRRHPEGFRHRKVRMALAEIDFSEGAYDKAKERILPVFEGASDFSGASMLDAKELLGRIFLQQGKFQEAARCYATIMGSDDTRENDMVCRKRFADALMGMNLFKSAIAHYNRAIEIAEKSSGESASEVIAESCERIARSYYETGDFAKSAHMYKKFLARTSGVNDGRRLWALYRMGMGHAKLSDSLVTEQIFASLRENGKDPFWEQLADFSKDFEKWRDQYGDYVRLE